MMKEPWIGSSLKVYLRKSNLGNEINYTWKQHWCFWGSQNVRKLSLKYALLPDKAGPSPDPDTTVRIQVNKMDQLQWKIIGQATWYKYKYLQPVLMCTIKATLVCKQKKKRKKKDGWLLLYVGKANLQSRRSSV